MDRFRWTLGAIACGVLLFSAGVLAANELIKPETNTIRRFKVHTLTETKRVRVPVTTTLYSTETLFNTVTDTQTETVTETIFDEGSISGILNAILPKEKHKERKWKQNK